MRGSVRIGVIACVLLAATARPASAFETPGRLGLGYDADLNGINLRYFFTQFGIDLTLGFALETKTADGEQARFDLIVAPKLVYAMELHKNINLNALGGFYFQVLGSHTDEQTDLNLGFFGGLAPELVIWDHIAVEVFFGLAANINNLREKQAAKTSFSLGTIGRRLSVVSGAVFRYYF